MSTSLMFILFCVCFAHAFLTENKHEATIGPSNQHDIIADVLAIVVEEKDLRHQLEEAVTKLHQDLEAVKQQNDKLRNETIDKTKELEDIIKNNTELKRELDDVIKTNTALKQTVDDVIMKNTELKQKVDNVIMNNTAMQKKIDDVEKEQQLRAIKIGFTCEVTSSRISSSPTIFSNVIANIGSGYNASDGKFYCPKAGMYLFTVSLKSNCAGFNIFVNGHSVEYTHAKASGTGGLDTGVLTYIADLAIGDTVWIQGWASLTIEYAYFSGVLID